MLNLGTRKHPQFVQWFMMCLYPVNGVELEDKNRGRAHVHVASNGLEAGKRVRNGRHSTVSVVVPTAVAVAVAAVLATAVAGVCLYVGPVQVHVPVDAHEVRERAVHGGGVH